MDDEVQLILEEAKEKMGHALEHLEAELAKIRAGKATPAMLDGIHVDYYGTDTPLSQVSNINTPDARSITVQPWEKKMLEVIEKAILAANIGLTPINNGEVIRISIPPLTEERRSQLVKQVKSEGETSKIGVRHAREWAKKELKRMQKEEGLSEDAEKDAENDLQKLTDEHIKKVDEIVEKKEEDIMTI